MADMVKVFGCRQAYESPSCRNPRSACFELWGFMFWGFQGLSSLRSVYWPDRVDDAACGLGACPTGSDRHSAWRKPSQWPSLV